MGNLFVRRYCETSFVSRFLLNTKEAAVEYTFSSLFHADYRPLTLPFCRPAVLVVILPSSPSMRIVRLETGWRHVEQSKMERMEMGSDYRERLLRRCEYRSGFLKLMAECMFSFAIRSNGVASTTFACSCVTLNQYHSIVLSSTLV